MDKLFGLRTILVTYDESNEYHLRNHPRTKRDNDCDTAWQSKGAFSVDIMNERGEIGGGSKSYLQSLETKGEPWDARLLHGQL